MTGFLWYFSHFFEFSTAPPLTKTGICGILESSENCVLWTNPKQCETKRRCVMKAFYFVLGIVWVAAAVFTAYVVFSSSSPAAAAVGCAVIAISIYYSVTDFMLVVRLSRPEKHWTLRQPRWSHTNVWPAFLREFQNNWNFVKKKK